MTIEISLTRGKFTVINDEDADLTQFKWYAAHLPRSGRNNEFVVRRHVRLDGKKCQQLIHRVILSRVLGRSLMSNEQVDHINGNSLDNRRSNLRLATNGQNGMNKGKTRRNASGYKGVYWHKRVQKWTAEIKLNKKKYHLGYFDTPEEAFEQYKKAAVELHGEFAKWD